MLALPALSLGQTDRPSCWLVVGDQGRAAAIAKFGAEALTEAGFDVASRNSGRAPSAIVVFPRAVRDEAEMGVLHQMVEEGAGLVVVYSMTPELRDATQELLAPWHASLVPSSPDSGKLKILAHEITRGLDKLFVWRVPGTLTGVEPILKQGSNVIGGVSTRGGKRLVIVPLDAIVPGQSADTIPPPNLQLLVQAVSWAARNAAPEKTVVAPENRPPLPVTPAIPRTAPVDRGEYRRLAYTDMGAEDENWPAIREAVENLLKDANLEPKDVQGRQPRAHADKDRPKEAVDPRDAPLVRALKDSPALVVLGSWREFADVETVALSAYVRAGGALLVLPRGTNQTNMRIVSVNAVLIEFGMAVSLEREAGELELIKSPLTEGLAKITRVPAGILVTGYRGTDVARCKGYSLVRVDEIESGRVAVADPLPMVDPAVDTSGQKAWRDLLARLIGWLTQGMKFQ